MAAASETANATPQLESWLLYMLNSLYPCQVTSSVSSHILLHLLSSGVEYIPSCIGFIDVAQEKQT